MPDDLTFPDPHASLHPHGNRPASDDGGFTDANARQAQGEAKIAALEAKLAAQANEITALRSRVETMDTLLLQVSRVLKPDKRGQIWGSQSTVAGWEDTGTC